jgi:hypothetical protein
MPDLLGQWFRGVRPETTLRHGGPPSCLEPPAARLCPSRACTSQAAAAYHAMPPAGVLPRLDAAGAAQLRVFFLDGHVGPLNDMMATLHEVVGVPAANFDAMVFGQGMLVRSAIDRRFFQCRSCLIGAEEARKMARWLTYNKSAGRAFTIPACEKYRCREAVHNDQLRREFAQQFGALLQRSFDVVACNFPTWQCLLFMYVNVTVVMRFTHRCPCPRTLPFALL